MKHIKTHCKLYNRPHFIKAICAMLLCLLFMQQTAYASSEPSDDTVFEFHEEAGGAEYVIADYWLETAQFKGDHDVKSAVLCEASSGRVLYQKNQDDRLPIASVTKVMTMLLTMEAIDDGRLKYSDTVTVSAHAASMGGSQMYLEVGETMTVSDMLKAIAVASANDAAVAMAEHIAGTEEGFAELMNECAERIGCRNTHFVNASGLPVDNAYSSALDVALITREILKHKDILKYTSIWTDSLRNGAFGLANTNKLIRYYKGANGMKTGYTDEAKYCLSGTAERDGMTLIAVVLGGVTSDERFACAKSMLDYGFATYKLVTAPAEIPETVRVTGGRQRQVKTHFEPLSLLDSKSGSGIKADVYINEAVKAPVAEGDRVGYVIYRSGGDELARADIIAAETVIEADFGFLLLETVKNAFLLTHCD